MDQTQREVLSKAFDAGAKAAVRSMIDALEKVCLVNPQMSFAEVIMLIREIANSSEISKQN